MKTLKKSKQFSVFCECMHPEHTLQLLVDEDENRAYLYINLSDLPWYRRVFVAIKYIFGNNDLAYEETIIDYSNSRKFVNALNKLKRDYKRKVEF